MTARRLYLVLTLSVLVGVFSLTSIQAAQTDPVSADRLRVVDIDLLGELTFETGLTFEDTVVGGLSGLVYDATNEVYYAMADDRSQNNPARFYTLSIDVADGTLDDGDVVFENVTTLLNEDGEPYPELSLDPEGIALMADGRMFISSEGDVKNGVDPFIHEISIEGELLNALPIPEKYLPNEDGTLGIRNNLAFESLTVTPDQTYLIAAIENALVQDGPAASLDDESLVRVLKYDLATGKPVQEMVYVTDPVPMAPVPEDDFSTNGLVDLLPLDNNGTLIAMERAYSAGVGNTVKLYEATTQGALDVFGAENLLAEDGETVLEMDPPIAKRFLLDFAEMGLTADNLEGLAMGPKLEDGRQVVIVVSDNNFNESQVTQFIALALTTETIPAALPVLETPRTIEGEEPIEGAFAGDSDDPAIWVHPTDAAKSLVIVTLKDGGMLVLNLAGEVVQELLTENYGEQRYNNVDLIYGFELDGQTVDLAVASDRENDTVAIFSIDAETGELTNVTADDIIETIFGVDDGEQTAYGLTAYQSPVSGIPYVFVSQADGKLIAQLALSDNGSGQVQAELVRMVAVPEISEDVADSQTEGMVTDNELGFVYIAMEEGEGIFKFRAEPDGGDEPEPVRSFNRDVLQPDLEGLTMYYGPNGSGYLLVSSQGDSTYAVFERTGDNAYLGSFLIGNNGDIDQANESDGADVINVALGDAFPNGLLVVQDGANDPQVSVIDEEELENHSNNFKFVPWENVANAFPEPLLIDTESYHPRGK